MERPSLYWDGGLRFHAACYLFVFQVTERMSSVLTGTHRKLSLHLVVKTPSNPSNSGIPDQETV